jgi:hypothetical protein
VVFPDRQVNFGQYVELVSALLLVLTAVKNPGGIVGEMRSQRARLLAWRSERVSGRSSPQMAVPATEQPLIKR